MVGNLRFQDAGFFDMDILMTFIYIYDIIFYSVSIIFYYIILYYTILCYIIFYYTRL